MTAKKTPQDRYITVATRSFADHGFHGASLALIAREAGVSKQALLHYFPSKAALYAAVLTALSERLVAKIEAAEGATAEARLERYLERQVAETLAKGEDARLVVRALLDSREGARRWPLKAYLDRLVALGRETERWAQSRDEDILAALYVVIGASQYMAISEVTLTGILGAKASARAKARVLEEAKAVVRRMLAV